MDEKSREVLLTYAGLNLPHMVARTLTGSRPFLMASIVGELAVGKSSYAYYSLKTGIMAYLYPEAPALTALHDDKGIICMERRTAEKILEMLRGD